MNSFPKSVILLFYEFQYINIKSPFGECDEKKLSLFDVYTWESCVLECTIRHYVNKCKCRPAATPKLGKFLTGI